MAIGINDIIAAGELAIKLYDWGSSKFTTAYIEYRDFMRDIKNVSLALRAIHRVIKNFTDRHASMRLDFSTLELAIGGVDDTLKRCERLLRENPKFQWTEGFIVNIEWNFDLAERVKTLQTRVLFHCTKINLVIQPLQMHITSHLGETLALMHEDFDDRFEDVAEQLEAIKNALAVPTPTTGPRPTVPAEIVLLFEEASSFKPLTGSAIIQDCLDAVVYWYEESTKSFVAEPPTMMRPGTSQYLNLLKCLWLLKRARENPRFETFCHDTLAKAYVRKLDRRVFYQFKRFQGESALQTPEIEELMFEAADRLEIWPDLGIIDTLPAITEAQSYELQLFRFPLQRLVRNRDQELTVFRSGDDSLRLAIAITSPNIAVADRYNHKLDCRKAVLVPIYAHPKNQSSCSLSWKTSTDDPSMEELPFKSKANVLDFQECITNFAVRGHYNSLRAVRAKGSAWKGDGRLGTELGSEGLVQLWLYRKPRTIDRSQRQQSIISSKTSATSTSTRGWTKEYLERTNTRSNIRSVESGGYLDAPVPGRLVIYTLYKEELRLVSINLDGSTIIDTNLCDCSNKKKAAECKRVCIRQNGEQIKVKVYDTASTQDMSTFNIALLRHPPHADAERNVVESSFKFLTLDLSSVAEREHLSQSFATLTATVRRNVAIYNEDLKGLRGQHVHKEK